MTFKKNLLGFSITTSFTIIVLLTLNCTSIAGELDSPSAPTNVSSGMYTTSDIYNRLNSGASSSISTFNEPTQTPANQGYNLNQIMAITPQVDNQSGATPSDVEFGKKFWGLKDGTWGLQTGTRITTSSCIPPAYIMNSPDDPNNYVDGTGARWCIPGDGTVIDLNTGLVWLRDLGTLGSHPWTGCQDIPCNFGGQIGGTGKTAVGILAELQDGVFNLTDGSVSGDWRAPTLNEILLLSSPSFAENLEVGAAVNPFYNIPVNTWTSSHSPNISTSFPGETKVYYVVFLKLQQERTSVGTHSVNFGVVPVRRRKDLSQ